MHEILKNMSPEKKQAFDRYWRIATILLILNLVWWIVSIIYHQFILTTYKTSDGFRTALLNADAIELAIIFALIPIAYVAWKEKDRETLHFKFLIKRILYLGISIGILVVCNLTTYLVTGIADDILIFYQLWTAPASLLLLQTLVRFQ